MGIIAKNIIVGGKVEEKSAPPPTKFINVFEKIRQGRRETPVEKIEETPEEKYKHVHHGDLHRLFNTKSSYLKDMTSLED